MCVLEVIESVTLSGRAGPIKGTGGTGQGGVEKHRSSVSSLKALACLLPDSVMLHESHVQVIGTNTPSKLTNIEREGWGGGEEREHPRPSISVPPACPSSSLSSTRTRTRTHTRTRSDGCLNYPVSASMLLSPNVSQMMTAARFNDSLCALHTHAAEGVVFIPFRCSLSQMSSLPTHIRVRTPASVRTSVSPTGHTSNAIYVPSSDPSVVTRRFDYERHRYNGDTVTSADTAFAMGLSVVYTDALTPVDCVTVLTLAYHSADRAFTRTHAVDLSPHNSNPPLRDTYHSTNSTHPLQIKIPDFSSGVHFSESIEHEQHEQEALGKEVAQIEEEGKREKEGDGDGNDAVSLTTESASLESAPFNLHSSSNHVLDTHTISAPSASETNKSEGGLFGYVIEAMTHFTSDLFSDVTQQVHLLRGWNVLHRNFLTPPDSPIIRDCELRRDYEEINAPQYLVPQANAWVHVEAVKLLLMFLMQRSAASPLHFLSFLQSPLLLIAESLGTFNGDVLQIGNKTVRVRTPHTGTTESVCGGHDLLNDLVRNLSAAFRNRCRCFFETPGQKKIRGEDAEIGMGVQGVTGRDKALNTDTDTDTDRDRDGGAGTEGRRVLHILISPPPSPSSTSHGDGTEGTLNFAAHICIPSLSQREHTPSSSTVKCRLKEKGKGKGKEKESRKGESLKSKRDPSDVSTLRTKKEKKTDISRREKDKSRTPSRGLLKDKSGAVLPFISLIEGHSSEEYSSRHVRTEGGNRGQRDVIDTVVARQRALAYSEEKRKEQFISQVVNIILYTVSSSV